MKFFNSFVFLACLFSSIGFALPINFGIHQGDLEYSETKTKNFIIYHDKRVPNEARVVANSLEAAKPILEQWMGVTRDSRLPVIMSAVTDEASFANFLLDVIELQTMGRGGRDLAFHEVTHNIMYRHLDNILGPAGSIIHLPFLPAWFIEGLAEALSVSSQSDMQSAMERYHAATGDWPTYSKLHSLYQNSGFAFTGYLTSGAFVSYILRTYDANKLFTLLDDFYDYSMPWWWPWSAVPFNGFMPFDEALYNLTGKSGEELYEEYKKKATEHWKQKNLGYVATPTKNKNHTSRFAHKKHSHGGMVAGLSRIYPYGTTAGYRMKGDRLTGVFSKGDAYEEVELVTKEKSKEFRRGKTLNKTLNNMTRVASFSPLTKVYVKISRQDNLDWQSKIAVRNKGKKPFFAIKRVGSVTNIFQSSKNIYWLEAEKEWSKLCYIPKKDLTRSLKKNSKSIKCPERSKLPKYLSFLGEKTSSNGFTSKIFLVEKEETLLGDRFSIKEFSTLNNRSKVIPNPLGGEPISLGFVEGNPWMMLADRSSQFLRSLDKEFQCIEERVFGNTGSRIIGGRGENLTIILDDEIYNLPKDDLKKRECGFRDSHISPLLYTIASAKPISLSEALKNSSTWEEPNQETIQEYNRRLAAAKPATVPKTKKLRPARPQEAKWRGGPALGFPWIGADAEGLQVGMISVPLIDDMHNERVDLQMLYGLTSRFPHTELSLTSTRFSQTYKVDVFRYQTWNGVARNSQTDEVSSMYYDERGARLSTFQYFRPFGMSLEYGIKSATLTPEIGPIEVRKGHLNELFFNTSKSFGLGFSNLSTNISVLGTPEFMNKNFIYNKLTLGTTLAIPIQSSTLSFGVSGSRTRGKKRKFLKESYRPLKTFVPGSGGGINEINVTLFGPGALTSAKYGDSQGRAKMTWTLPLMSDLTMNNRICYPRRINNKVDLLSSMYERMNEETERETVIERKVGR